MLVERTAGADDAIPVYVWIGGDYEGVADPEDEEVSCCPLLGPWRA